MKFRKFVNEDIAITDPALAQQYLAVQKQMSDKTQKKNQLLKQVNQVDSELAILDKNLLAIQSKSASNNASKQETQPQEEISSETQTQKETNESMKTPTLDQYREDVIASIDKDHHDGETLAYEFENLVDYGFKNKIGPWETAQKIITADVDYDNVNITESYKLNEDDYAECDDESKMAKIQLQTIVDSATELLELIDNCEQIDAWIQKKLTLAEDYIETIKKYMKYEAGDNQVTNQEDDMMIEPMVPTVQREIEVPLDLDVTDDVYDEYEFENNKFDDDKDDEFSLETSVKDVNYKPNVKHINARTIDDSYIGGDTFGKKEANMNESLVDDIQIDIEKEISKLTDIKNFIENYDNTDIDSEEDLYTNLEDDVVIDDEIEMEVEPDIEKKNLLTREKMNF